MQKNLLRQKAREVHVSKILPPRIHNPELAESVKNIGLQQFLIVRPDPSHPGEYELIDGRDRWNALGPEEDVWLDVREKATDAEVFKISEATSKRTQRSTYDNARFYAAYIDAVKKETGQEEAFSRVAKESQISESKLSQLLKIDRLFCRLAEKSPETKFEKLKGMGMNKLYELAQLVDHDKLVAFALQVEENAEIITVEEINQMVEQARLFLDDATVTTAQQMPVPSQEPREIGDIKVRFKKVSSRLSMMVKELDTALSQVALQEIPEESVSPETLTTLQKILTSVRRVTYYLKKLKEKFPDQTQSSSVDAASDKKEDKEVV